MTDPTYVRAAIDANPVWSLAFVLSEVLNDNAPIGWGKYIPHAQAVLDRFTLTPKSEPTHAPKET